MAGIYPKAIPPIINAHKQVNEMQYYVKFIELQNREWNKLQNKLVECEPRPVYAISSDSVLPLDGRIGLDKAVSEAFLQLAKLLKHHDYIGFSIIKNGHVIYSKNKLNLPVTGE